MKQLARFFKYQWYLVDTALWAGSAMADNGQIPKGLRAKVLAVWDVVSLHWTDWKLPGCCSRHSYPVLGPDYLTGLLSFRYIQ